MSAGGHSATFSEDFRKDAIEHYVAALTALGYDVATAMGDFVAARPAEDLLQWLAQTYYNVRNRRITQGPRLVKRSGSLQARSLPSSIAVAVDRVAAASEAGLDLNTHLSRTTTQLEYDDPLLNEWGVHHLHLGSPASLPGEFVGRTNALLFVMVRPDCLFFVDVFEHGDWAEDEIIETIHGNWPEQIAHSHYPGVSSLQEPNPTPRDRMMLRKAGMGMPYQTRDGTVYGMPGGGVATSRASVRAVSYGIRIRKALQRARDHAEAHADAFVLRARRAGAVQTPITLRLSIIDDEGALKITETERGEVLAAGGL